MRSEFSHNPSRTIMGFESESMLIIMFSGLMDRKKGKGDLQVVYTSRYQMFQKGDEGQCGPPLIAT